MPFVKGQSGNPTGRPLSYRNYVRKLVGEHGEKAFDILWEIAQGQRKTTKWLSQEGGPVEVGVKPSIKEQHDAAIALAEHLNGRPTQAMELEHSGGLSINFTTNVRK